MTANPAPSSYTTWTKVVLDMASVFAAQDVDPSADVEYLSGLTISEFRVDGV